MSAQYEYELMITRRTPNPDYQPRNAMAYSYQHEQTQFLEQRTCLVSLTESEYQAVKQALVEHWAK